MYAAKGDYNNASLNLAAAAIGIFVAGEGKLVVKGGVLTAEELLTGEKNNTYYTVAKETETNGGTNVDVTVKHEGNTAEKTPTGTVIQGDKLVNADQAIIDSNKITSYALNPEHPVGGNKAKVFESALGYNQSNANDLISKIQEGVKTNSAIPGKIDEYGQRVTIDMPITGPNGKTATVRTGWIYDSGSSIPRLTTLYVK